MIFHFLRLIIRLMADRRVPIWVKLIPVAAVAYILSPIDLRPDFIPVLGQIDDLLITILLLVLFIVLAPSEARRDGLTFRKRCSHGTSRKSRSRWKAEYETLTMTLLLANYVFPGKKI